MSETGNEKKTDQNDFDLNTWKNRFQDLVSSAQEEIKKTTAIGKKMLSASQSNSTLHDTYEELGMLAEKAIRNKDLVWDDPKVSELISEIKKLKEDLSKYESDVRDIKTTRPE